MRFLCGIPRDSAARFLGRAEIPTRGAPPPCSAKRSERPARPPRRRQPRPGSSPRPRRSRGRKDITLTHKQDRRIPIRVRFLEILPDSWDFARFLGTPPPRRARFRREIPEIPAAGGDGESQESSGISRCVGHCPEVTTADGSFRKICAVHVNLPPTLEMARTPAACSRRDRLFAQCCC